jgi:ribonuclease BN (tRNA processing enzyme)
MSLALTVLGGSPAWPNPGQAASGYVVESDGTRLLMDCGSGIAAELRARDPGPLTAIVISHFHADHWFDLVPLHYAYLFGNWNTRQQPDLHLPPGGRDVLDSVARSWGGTVATFDDAYAITEFDPAAPLQIGDLRLSFLATRHYTVCYAIRIECGGRTLVYSADSGPLDGLADFAEGAELFICEASLPDATADDPERGHMTPAEAAVTAVEAGAGRLLLTHVPAESGEERVLSDARAVFPGTVDVAHPGLRIEVREG